MKTVKSKLFPIQLIKFLDEIELKANELGSMDEAITHFDQHPSLTLIEINEEKVTRKGNLVYLATIRYFIYHGIRLPRLFAIDLSEAIGDVLYLDKNEQTSENKQKALSNGLYITSPNGGKTPNISDDRIWGEVKTKVFQCGVKESKAIGMVSNELKISRATVSDKYYRVELKIKNTNKPEQSD